MGRALIAFGFAAVLILCVDRCCASRELLGSGVIVDKLYKPSSSSTGTMLVTDSKGNLQPVMTSSFEPEAWILIVSIEGTTESMNVNSSLWGSVEKGSRQPVYRITGRLGTYGLAL